MFDWLKPKPAPFRLAGLLADYPPSTPPHLGATAAPLAGQPMLTLEQCRENLRALRSAMPHRLALLGSALDRLGVSADDAYRDADVFVTRLHRVLRSELPPLYRPELGTHAAREVSTRDGPHIVLSFMADLALLEADVLMRAKPGCFLGLNVNPRDRKMLSWRRPCLLGLVDRHFPEIESVFHVEANWFGFYNNMDDPSRLAAPEHVMPETWSIVIGGTILQRLDRDIVDPDLEEKLRTTWLGEARTA